MALQEKNPVSEAGFSIRQCGSNTVTPMQGGQIGATGNAGDRLQRLIVQIANPNSSLVSILDQNTEYTLVAPGALVPGGPLFIELGIYSMNGPWSVRLGQGCTATAVGRFS